MVMGGYWRREDFMWFSGLIFVITTIFSGITVGSGYDIFGCIMLIIGGILSILALLEAIRNTQ